VELPGARLSFPWPPDSWKRPTTRAEPVTVNLTQYMLPALTGKLAGIKGSRWGVEKPERVVSSLTKYPAEAICSAGWQALKHG